MTTTPPPAPKRTPEMIKSAVLEFIQRHDFDWAKDDQEKAADDIAKHWQPFMDGYQLARVLDSMAWWDIDLATAEDLDNIGSVVREKHEALRRKWAEQWNIQPPLPVGTRITKGVITGLSEYKAATYEVKEDAPRWPDSRLLVLFEDAVAVEATTEGGSA